MDEARRDAFAGRLFAAGVGALDLLHVYLGDRLGLYRAMTAGEPFTVADLASAAGVDERYAQEWLDHEAVSGTLDVAIEDNEKRHYVLPAEHAEVLSNETSLSYLAPIALGVVGVARTMPLLMDAFVKGAGIAYEEYGADLRDAISRGNRPMFVHLLASDWFPQVPGVVERLTADPPARVADVGCGVGWSSIAMAHAYPTAHIHGIDLDPASIAEAKANAGAEGVADRVNFERRDAADPDLAGQFDLVCAFETIHDMSDPVSALRTMRSLRAEGGTVLVVDERVADSFTVDVEDAERFQGGWSALHCLPLSLLEPPAAGTGTIMRFPTLLKYAQQAGFAGIEVLPIENDLWRFYILQD